MNIPRKIGIGIDFGVPAIVGGGLVQYFAESWSAVAVYEALLLVIMIAVLSMKLSDGE
ncbi:MAG: hypothetical protein V1753_06370 [Pseudomonadota bacterium]